jgi:hypothetical protein
MCDPQISSFLGVWVRRDHITKMQYISKPGQARTLVRVKDRNESTVR